MTLAEALDALHQAGRFKWSPGIRVGLLALLREAVSEWAHSAARAETGADADGWYVWVDTGPFARERFTAATEGEAIAAALIALAGAL